MDSDKYEMRGNELLLEIYRIRENLDDPEKLAGVAEFTGKPVEVIEAEFRKELAEIKKQLQELDEERRGEAIGILRGTLEVLSKYEDLLKIQADRNDSDLEDVERAKQDIESLIENMSD